MASISTTLSYRPSYHQVAFTAIGSAATQFYEEIESWHVKLADAIMHIWLSTSTNQSPLPEYINQINQSLSLIGSDPCSVSLL